MIFFITALILAVVFILALVVMNKLKTPNAGTVAVLSLVGAVVLLALSATTIVPPRTVGITVSFGKPTQVLGNGIHMKAPWASVEKLDGAVQNDVYNSDHAVEIRLGNNSKANADASIQWQLRTEDAMEVFLDYRTFENIQQNLVDRNFRASMNEVMSEYNPLDSLQSAEGGADLAQLSEEVLKRMNEKVGDRIDVRSVTIPIINFDASTQARIDELQQETARTRIAEQKKDTSRAEAQANSELESSLSEEVLISKCLDIVSESGQSPIGCFPGTGVSPVTMVGDNNNQQ